jgi:hypothetical protein
MLASISPLVNSTLRADATASALLERCAMKSLEEFKAHRRARVALLMEAVGQSRLAALTGISPAYLYAISTAKGKAARPVNDETVEVIQEALKELPPRWIDGEAPLPDLKLDELKKGTLPPGWAESRDANNMEAVRIALGAIVATLATRRPDEGDEIARLLRQAPQKFLEREGLVFALVEAAETAARKARARPRAPRGSKSSSSKGTAS